MGGCKTLDHKRKFSSRPNVSSLFRRRLTVTAAGDGEKLSYCSHFHVVLEYLDAIINPLPVERTFVQKPLSVLDAFGLEEDRIAPAVSRPIAHHSSSRDASKGL